MVNKVLVYYHGVIGIPGKGPHWIDTYEPNKTIGQIINRMEELKLGERNKRIEMFKFERGNMSKFDRNNPYWHHDTKLSEYVSIMGGNPINDVMMIFFLV